MSECWGLYKQEEKQPKREIANDESVTPAPKRLRVATPQSSEKQTEEETQQNAEKEAKAEAAKAEKVAKAEAAKAEAAKAEAEAEAAGGPSPRKKTMTEIQGRKVDGLRLVFTEARAKAAHYEKKIAKSNDWVSPNSVKKFKNAVQALETAMDELEVSKKMLWHDTYTKKLVFESKKDPQQDKANSMLMIQVLGLEAKISALKNANAALSRAEGEAGSP